MPTLTDFADELLARYGAGETFIELCAAYGLTPDDLYGRLETDTEFRRQYEAARFKLADTMDELAYLAARDATADTVEIARLQVTAFQRRASRLNPARYNDTRAALIQNNVNLIGHAGSANAADARQRLFAMIDGISERLEQGDREQYPITTCITAALRDVEQQRRLDLAKDRSLILAIVADAIALKAIPYIAAAE